MGIFDFTPLDGGIIVNEEGLPERNAKVLSVARIAVYHDPLAAPRIVDIPPQGVFEFIEAVSSSTYELSHQQGGTFPYAVIHELAENFIHAGFEECTVSILDGGKTLRFADQGPGITKKDLVLQPGVSSATQRMKDYIRGVGSGLHFVREYLSASHGFIDIVDNAGSGVVITITVSEPAAPFESIEQVPDIPISPVQPEKQPALVRNLGKREEQALQLLNEHGMLGPVDMAVFLNVSAATATRLFKKLELAGMVESTQLKKRILSNVGMNYVQSFLML